MQCNLEGQCSSCSNPRGVLRSSSGSHLGGGGHCDIHFTCQRLFFLCHGDGSCLVKWGLGVMGLPGCVEVECLDVSSSMGFGILFGANYHAGHHVTGLLIRTSSMMPRQIS